MLIIRQAQFAAFEHAAARDSAVRALRSLRARGTVFPDLPEAELAQHIAAARVTAAGFGIARPDDFGTFVTLCARHGWRFPDMPANAWMSAMLKDPGVDSAAERLRRLVDEMAYRDAQRQRERTLISEFFPTAGVQA